MAIQVTTWSPDTCGCTFQYSWDDTAGPNPPTTFFAAPIICSFHISLASQHMKLARENPEEHIRLVDSKFPIIDEIIERNEKRIIA